MTYEYIRVTYEQHASVYEWYANDIRELNISICYLFCTSFCMLLVYHSYLIVCHFFVTRVSFVCHSYANRMYSFVIRISLCSRMSLVCHSYIFESHSYVTRMYSYVFRMSLVWTRMSFVYVTRMYSYVSRMCFYHEPLNMILVD